MKKTAGIHHITAIVGDPQRNLDFYAGILGLRFVKKTINFDDPETYHFYLGNDKGAPGTIITFFPWINAYNGKIGDGQVGVTTYAVPTGSLNFWEARLKKFNIEYEKTTRFGEDYLYFEDPDGLRLELVETDEGDPNEWTIGEVTKDVAIKGFRGATLYSARPDKTSETLEYMGLEKIGEDAGLIRFKASGEIGNTIDVKDTATGIGQIGVGTVHHIAWRAEDDKDQLDWKRYIESKGLGVTPVQDRNYFNAIYFREYGEILFEIATDPPGFLIDEPYETLGQDLKLPSQYEQHRETLNRLLVPVEVRNLDEK